MPANESGTELYALRFFVPMHPPTATHQTMAVRVVNGKPMFYEPPRLLQARGKLGAALAPHRPAKPLQGPLRVLVKWCFMAKGKHKPNEWRTTKPDTHNLNKLLFDVMTAKRFWKDDAQVVSEIIEKFWSDTPGIYIEIAQL
jgi:Holliday junction resolvase RusA-like endonuclease